MADDRDGAAETARLLAETYRRIAEGAMRDIPLYNDALEVDTIGFHQRPEGVFGVVLTPWFMNLTLVPDDGAPGARPGETVRLSFPAGRFDFTVGELDGIGRILTCSLFSPMFEFEEPAVARATAEAALEALMKADNREDVIRPSDETDTDTGTDSAPARPVDRRGFLRGDFAGRGAE